MDPDERRTAPAVARNRDPILEVLRPLLVEAGLVLEIASGTGQHVAHFAAALPDLAWQPSEADAAFHPSIRAWTQAEGLSNVRAPLAFDVRLPWPVTCADAVLCIGGSWGSLAEVALAVRTGVPVVALDGWELPAPGVEGAASVAEAVAQVLARAREAAHGPA